MRRPAKASSGITTAQLRAGSRSGTDNHCSKTTARPPGRLTRRSVRGRPGLCSPALSVSSGGRSGDDLLGSEKSGREQSQCRLTPSPSSPQTQQQTNYFFPSWGFPGETFQDSILRWNGVLQLQRQKELPQARSVRENIMSRSQHG